MNLGFGLGWAVPEAVKSAWGARMIFPDDLLQNRQDLVAEDDAEKAKLIRWLNGKAANGAIKRARAAARKAKQRWHLSSDGDQKVILYQDAAGVIVASPQKSHGYLYVAGWLHEGDAAKQAAAEFEPLAAL